MSLKKQARIVALDRIGIDRSYQRDEISEQKLAAMESNYSEEACTPPTLGEREDGSLWVVDGQQRIALERRRGTERMLCFVFASRGQQHEAGVYMKINGPPLQLQRGTGRNRMYGTDVFKAAVVAGVEPYSSVGAYLKERGYKVDRHGKRGTVGFVTMLARCWDCDREAAKRAFEMSEKIASADGGTLHQSIFRGLWWLFRNGPQHGLDPAEYTKKLIRAGGSDIMLGEIRRKAMDMKRGVCEHVAGNAILDMMMKGKRNKVQIAKQ